jgi:hypothetical protein
MNVDSGNEAAQFLFWEYINWIFFAVLFRIPGEYLNRSQIYECRN